MEARGASHHSALDLDNLRVKRRVLVREVFSIEVATRSSI